MMCNRDNVFRTRVKNASFNINKDAGNGTLMYMK